MKNIKLELIFLFLLLVLFKPASANSFLIQTDASCKVWWTGITSKIMNNTTVPVKNGKIILHSALNESEGFQLVLSPLVSIDDVSVSVSDFRKKDGTLISSGNVTVRNVEYVHVTKPSGKLNKEGWYPDPLPLYEKPFRIEASLNYPVLITVKVPKNAASGTYSAKISLKSSKWASSVPVELSVWNFSLPDVPTMRSAFGLYSDLIKQYHNISTDEELKQVLDLYYRSFKEYRISPQQFFDMYPIQKTVKGVWWNGGTFDPDTVFAGKYSFQVNDGKIAGTCADLIKISPEKPYLLRWQAKTLKEKQQYYVTVKSYNADKKLIPWHLQGMFYSGSTHWKKDSLYLDPVNPVVYEDLVLSRPLPKEAEYVSIQLYAVFPDECGSEKGTAWFDDFQFLDIKAGKNLLPHGNFEQDINELVLDVNYTEFDKAAHKYLDGYGFTGFRMKVPELRTGNFVGLRTACFNGFINGTAEYRKLISIYLKGFQDHLEANGWLGKEYMYWVDEPKHDDYAFVREGMKTIHEVAPKLTRFITENNPGPEIMDVTEIGCPVLAKFDPKKSEEWIAKGRQMWSYLMTWPKEPHVNLFIDSDAINLRMWLWMSYRYHLTGILVWNSNMWNADGCSPEGVLQNIWEDPMTYMDGHGTPKGSAAEYGNGDGMFFYPPNRDPNNDKSKYLTGPVPSLRLEIMREGIDDYDYMMMLENCIKKARPDQQNLVKKAKQLLNFGADVFVDEKQYTKNPSVLQKYRLQMGDLLNAFSNSK